MYQVDLNCDLGESFGPYQMGRDQEVIPLITSANIACGFHASDPVTMERTVKLAAACGVQVGAHPGYPDLLGFGRRNMDVSPAEVRAYVTYQIGALFAFCKSQNIEISHVKPHGALYNMAAKDKALATAICEAIARFDNNLILLALAGTQMQYAAERTGLAFAREFFADRAYEEDGTLVPRGRQGAMITDEQEAIARVIRGIKERKVQAITGKEIPVKIDSICVHGDGPQALAFVTKIRKAVLEEGIALRPLKAFMTT